MVRGGKVFLNFDYFRKILEMMSNSSAKSKFRQAVCVGYCCYCQETVKTLKYIKKVFQPPIFCCTLSGIWLFCKLCPR